MKRHEINYDYLFYLGFEAMNALNTFKRNFPGHQYIGNDENSDKVKLYRDYDKKRKIVYECCEVIGVSYYDVIAAARVYDRFFAHTSGNYIPTNETLRRMIANFESEEI